MNREAHIVRWVTVGNKRCQDDFPDRIQHGWPMSSDVGDSNFKL